MGVKRIDKQQLTTVDVTNDFIWLYVVIYNRCPYAGCGNAVPLQMEHLEENHELRDYIQKQHKSWWGNFKSYVWLFKLDTITELV